ncbi:MAG: leucine-rich repeat protein [Spirochaetales bacterium]|nr:leucine-rich repeat protein [Spirochaetales bacterium]
MRNNQVTKFLILFVFVFLCSCDLFKSMCEAEKPPKQSTTLQQIVNDTNAGETIDLEKYSNEYDITDYNAEISKNLTIKNGSFQNTTLKIKAEVKLEKVQELSVETSANLTIRDSKLNNLLLGTNAESRSTNSGNTNFDLKVIVKNCEIAEKIKINSKAKLNIAGEKTKIAKIVVAVAAEVCKILCTTEVDTKKIENVITDENGEKPEEIKITQAYKITYHSNCDELENIEDFFSPDDGTISLPTDIFKRNDYIFAGWYKDKACTQIIDNFDVSKTTADINVYAGWTKYIPGSGVYKYSINIEDIPECGPWNGSRTSPAFSILLLTEKLIDASIKHGDFYFSNDAYQIQTRASENLRITDTSKTGNYAVYGEVPTNIDSIPENDKYKYYSGVAATVTDTTLEIFVDMSKIVKTELKVFRKSESSTAQEEFVTENTLIDLTDYKPYVIALGTKEASNNGLFTSLTWGADLMAMTESATFPTNLQQSAPEEQENFKDQFTTTPISGKTESFPYGFKFTTEKGYNCTYISDAAVSTGEQYNKVYAELNGATAAIATTPINKATGDSLNDDSTKIYVDSGKLVPASLYTITYDKKNGTVKLTDAAAGAKATSTTAQIADPDGNFPAGIYISGYLGDNWANNEDAGSALKMDVVDTANEVYSFTWVAPAATVTVTLKITMEDTNSTLYLKDVPVKTDGTSVIDGSIYSWNSGISVTIKNEDYSDITGGIFDAAMTATANADWALTNYVNGNKDVDLAEKFGMAGANDVLQLSIDVEKFVPYVKGQESVFSWNNAQGRLLAPTTGNTNSVTVTNISVSSTNHKTSYYVGEELDLTRLPIIEVKRSNGTTETLQPTSEMITGFDSSTAGTKTLTITYGGCTTTFNIEVKELTATADDVGTVIAGLSAGTYTLKVTGAITNDTITTIVTAMNNNTKAKINLDLSGTTGLTEIDDEAFYNCFRLTSITIPNSVTTIGTYAFSSCSSLTSIEIPDNVIEIKENAFISCTALNSVTIGNGVTSIGASAFYNCSGLTSIEIPDSVTTIDQQAFEACSNLASVTIGNKVTSIGDYAFSHCSNLTSVKINNGVTTIGSNAFEGCLSLTSVTIPSKVDNIGYRAFAKCSNLTKFEIDSGNQNYLSLDDGKILCRKIEDGTIFLIDYPSANGDVTIPENENITTIEHSAFYACSALTSVKIPEGVTTINDCAFEECGNLESVTIPASTTDIANFRAFAKCSNLTKFEIDSGNQNYLSLDGGKILCRKVEDGNIFLIDYPSANGDVTIPENEYITTIDHSAFWGCSMTNVTIPNSVTKIDCDAFLACANLVSITIPSSVVYIGTQAFSECSKLTSITFNDTGSTWYCTDSEEYTGGEIIDVTDTVQNANTLKVPYYDKYWYKSSTGGTAN